MSLVESIDTLARRNGKSAAAFRTISEVAADLDVPPHVLRFWESKFPQIKPLKRGGGRRYYRPEDIELLRRIRTLLYRDGYTIKGVQKLLKTPGARSPGEMDGVDGAGDEQAAASVEPVAMPVASAAAPKAAAPAQEPRVDLFSVALQRPLDAEARAVVAEVIADLEALRASLLPREE